jgi:hypothetical protein
MGNRFALLKIRTLLISYAQGFARTPEPRSSAPVDSSSLTENLPYRSRAWLCTATRIGWPSFHALCARCLLSTLLSIP